MRARLEQRSDGDAGAPARRGQECVRSVRAADAGVFQEHKWRQSVFISSIWLRESATFELWSSPDSRKLAARAGLFQPDKSGYERRT